MRSANGYTQEKLARALGVTRLTVQRWEHGRFSPRPDLRLRTAALLKVGPDEVGGWFTQAAEAHVPTSAPSPSAPGPETLSRLRAVIFGGGARPADMASVDSGKAVLRAHRLYQHADYDGVCRILPGVIAGFDERSTGAARRAAGYIAAAKLATKVGDTHLAWVTADRAHRAACEVGNPALIGVARYQVAAALHRSGNTDHAQAVAAEAADDLARNVEKHPHNVSARGALVLLSAVMFARSGATSTAQALLAEARALAEELRVDANHLWTGFGPTNVAIHELSVAAQSGSVEHARSLGAVIDTDRMPAVLVGRRAQVHLDLGRTAVTARDDSVAVLHLLEAERVANQAVSRNIVARGLIGTLLSREQHGTTPGLRALARRAGVEA